MARENVSAIVSGAGFVSGFITKLIVGEKTMDSDTYSIIVDWSRTLAEMIAAGRFDWKNDNIDEENFPLVRPSAGPTGPDLGPYRTAASNGQSETRVELTHYGKLMTTKQIKTDLDRRGLRPATLAELLALGEKYPDLQRKFQIVALGSAWVGPLGAPYVPFLYGGSGRRELSLGWAGPAREWSDHYRFLAVRK